MAENALKYLVSRINKDNGCLRGIKLRLDVQRLKPHNSFDASKKACYQIGRGVASVMGPDDPYLSSHVSSICNALDIPHFEIGPNVFQQNRVPSSINIHPDLSVLNSLYHDILEYYQWKDFVILYGDHERLLLLQSIYGTNLLRRPSIILRHATRSNMREIVKSLKNPDRKEHKHVFVDLDVETTQMMLRYALQEGIIDGLHHFILANPDTEAIPMDDYKHNHLNLTVIRLVKKGNASVQEVLKDMRSWERKTNKTVLNGSNFIKTRVALTYDAGLLFANALEALNKSASIYMGNLSCSDTKTWALGSSLYNYINRVQGVEGLTGSIRIDNGLRVSNVEFDILKLTDTDEALQKVGTWSTEKGLNITEPPTLKVRHFANQTLLITSRLEKPYVQLKKQDSTKPALEGNDRYEGFCIDLLSEISKIVGFEYEIELVPDGQYGIVNDKGEWTGMVRELIDGRADLAVAALTISYLRERSIDFTKPFLNLGISILFKVPKGETPGIFSFLNPLAVEIWIYIVLAYLAVSFTMFILARFSPYEWYNPHPCNPQTDEVRNVFNLSNSCWFTVGTLMQQGSDINPRAVSTRIVGGIWWFFTLIIISSYTANLAAFLTVERMVSPIESAEDLSKQTDIEYGTLEGGSTMTFFRESKIPTYQRMWAFMESRTPNVFTRTTEDGIERVKHSNYAYLMESTMLEYAIHRDCELMQVGGLLDSKGYGIGTPMGSPYRDQISMAILELQEGGRIQILYNKWWKNTGTCNRENAKKQDSKASALGLQNIGGVFVVLLAGLALSVVIAILEFTWNSKKNARTDKQSLCSEMGEELRFAVNCYGSNKRPALRRTCSVCKLGHPTVAHTHSPNGNHRDHRDHRDHRRNSHLSISYTDADANGHLQMREIRDGYLAVPDREGYSSDTNHDCRRHELT
ncbi:glutamate receptor ionotropic, kainate 2 [Lingula anatina]|uniref:Glutamate receptor ionotropic, kainate 2 n=1 Tax=Lingula anatina TaxID=7574 RepID=A0A1S3JDJ9_LINAN|nr:glutamate receptor ionotropic, kainate 2 [Lingula anatina]|eukprot:XP_013407964.2 glutamate receptor ionotropic, kainate 2 [Lingula anatina]